MDKETKIYLKTLQKYKKKYLPPEYNQLELLDHLCNPEIDFYISITNRGDGKSFNYPSALLYLAVTLDIKPCFVVRHYTLQSRIKELIEEIFITINWGDINQIWYRNTDDYIMVGLGDKEIAVITDLNNASDLKFSSQVLKHFPIIVYDEFTALESDYIPNEFEKLQLIYRSIDRIANRPYIKYPKIILLGNPVNFESPIFPALKLYNALENQEINTIQQYNNKLLELRRNDHVNATKNLRAFGDEEDSNITGQFNFSPYQLISESEYNKLEVNALSVKIDIGDGKCLYCINNNDKYVLSIEKLSGTEEYCVELKDETDSKEYLTSKFYKSDFSKYYEKGLFLFKDSFSKTYIKNNDHLLSINLFKCLPSTPPPRNDSESVFEKNAMDSYIKKLAERYE